MSYVPQVLLQLLERSLQLLIFQQQLVDPRGGWFELSP